MLFSIGHSNFGIEIFIQYLLTYDIQRLIDVRTIPYSRFCPQYNQQSLQRSLEEHGIVYVFRGHNLGGKGENVDYDQAISEVIELATSENVALMCSERDYKKCHRYTMIEADLDIFGTEITHITYQ